MAQAKKLPPTSEFDWENETNLASLESRHLGLLRIVKTGYMEKRGKINTAFQKRWFILHDDKRLEYYTDNKGELRGCISLLNAQASPLDKKHKDYSPDERSFAIVTPDRQFVLRTPSGQDSADWQNAIKDLLGKALRSEKEFQDAASTLKKYVETTTVNDTETARQKELEKCTQSFGETDARTALARHNLAYMLSSKGDLLNAEELYLEALRDLSAALGIHGEVAVCAGNLAVCYKRQNRQDSALPYFMMALKICAKTQGYTSNRTADILYNTYSCLFSQKRYRDARAFLLKSISINAQNLGPEHEEVVLSMAELEHLDGLISGSISI